MLARESHIGQHLVLAVVHQRAELEPARPKLVRHLPPGLPSRCLIGLQESLAERSRHDCVLAFRYVRERVSQPMNAAPLPRCVKRPGDLSITHIFDQPQEQL